MDNSTESELRGPETPSVEGCSKEGDERFRALSTLLDSLDEAAQADALSHTTTKDAYQMHLAQARLGVASSLFSALHAKHPPTAAHSLRVALGISSWSLVLDFTDEQRDLLEVAALLHDVGKMGVPDHVLAKPGKLNGEEMLLMERHRRLGQEILRGFSSSEALPEIVGYTSAWYDGTRHGFDRHGTALPLASRMIAIVDAFDSMTTDHVYRRAMSRERATAELYEFSGTQFDGELVKSFCEMVAGNQVDFQSTVARRWLQEIDPESANSLWSLGTSKARELPDPVRHAFYDQLLDTMHDGVVFIDEQLEVALWNRAAERMTGISSASVLHTQWSPEILRMCDEQGSTVSETDCPVLQVMRSGFQTLRRFEVAGRTANALSLDVHLAPVLAQNGRVQGAILILHDASSQITLEERVQTLHEKATHDPLTKIANRAEFDRVNERFVAMHLEQGVPCSLIICDIDHFKRINDNHGHQAGDEALIVFAALLQQHARAADLVARYGGEEFVVLCADCDNATATRRAEEMRRRIADSPQPSLGNKCITASFGVTEVQGGDTPETFLRRADRALLEAKGSGRNRVVQLGTGVVDAKKETPGFGWFSWFRTAESETLLQSTLVTVVPLNVTTEKLRGFVSDHHAEILSIEENRVLLRIDGQNTPMLRRRGDRPVPFLIELVFDQPENIRSSGKKNMGTQIHVTVRPKRQRDRRRRDAIDRARQLLVSFKSYLMAQEVTEETPIEENEAGDRNEKGEQFVAHANQVLSHCLEE